MNKIAHNTGKVARPIDRFPMHMQQAIRLIAAVIARKAQEKTVSDAPRD